MPLQLPLVSLAAEHLVMAYLLRRNIPTYKAPPNNEGYDLICVNPNAPRGRRLLRIQVKSRYATDGDGTLPIKEASFGAFEFLAAVLMNIGRFYESDVQPPQGREQPEILIIPASVARRYYRKVASGFNKLYTGNIDRTLYGAEPGVELVARALRIPYPRRPHKR